MPLFLSNSLFLLNIAINCRSIVITMRSISALLKSVANVKGLMTAPIPTNRHKFIILEPDIFPNNKSVSSFLADIIPVIISGKAVPIATIVIPMNRSDNPKLLAIVTELSTTKSAPNFSPKIPNIIYTIIIPME